MTAIRVLLADDHEMVRQGLARILDAEDGVEVVSQASGGFQAIEMVKEFEPHVVVLDYSMGDIDGAEVARRLTAEHPDLGIIILTVHENVHYAMHAIHAGARGFLVKADATEELVKAIRELARGGKYITPRLAGEVAHQLTVANSSRSAIERLSNREFELMRGLASGLPLRDCARRMKISESTASTYRQRVMTKLGLSSMAALIRFAIENGIDG